MVLDDLEECSLLMILGKILKTVVQEYHGAFTKNAVLCFGYGIEEWKIF